jgi:hypothetical protein
VIRENGRPLFALTVIPNSHLVGKVYPDPRQRPPALKSWPPQSYATQGRHPISFATISAASIAPLIFITVWGLIVAIVVRGALLAVVSDMTQNYAMEFVVPPVGPSALTACAWIVRQAN